MYDKTRIDKRIRKHRRCEKRRQKNKEKNNHILKLVYDHSVSFREAKSYIKYGAFQRDGEYLQVCSYFGICKSPCNGDC